MAPRIHHQKSRATVSRLIWMCKSYEWYPLTLLTNLVCIHWIPSGPSIGIMYAKGIEMHSTNVSGKKYGVLSYNVVRPGPLLLILFASWERDHKAIRFAADVHDLLMAKFRTLNCCALRSINSYIEWRLCKQSIAHVKDRAQLICSVLVQVGNRLGSFWGQHSLSMAMQRDKS